MELGISKNPKFRIFKDFSTNYTITYKSRLTQKKWQKKPDAIFSIYGKNGIIPWHFFSNSQLGLSRSLRLNDLRWWNFEAATSKFCNHSWNFGSSTKKVRWTSVWQTVPTFWFIGLCYISFCITYKSKVEYILQISNNPRLKVRVLR